MTFMEILIFSLYYSSLYSKKNAHYAGIMLDVLTIPLY